MPKGTRDIKRRIKSVGNTQKITKAMEMVSAAKMQRAVERVLASRAYADLAWQTVMHLAKKIERQSHPFFEVPKRVDRVAIIMISANRGLCGSFNTQLADKVEESIKLHYPEKRHTDILTLGAKAGAEAKRRSLKIVADFEKEDITYNSLTIRPVVNMAVKGFKEKEYNKVFVAYTDYESALKQYPHVKQILPIEPEVDKRLVISAMRFQC